MKTLRFFALVWSFFALVVAEAASTSASPPDCGLKCIVDLVAGSSCSLINTTCICTNQYLVESISLCLNSNCTVRDQLLTEKFSKETCGAPVINRRNLVSVTCLVGSSAAYIAFFLRIGARFVGGVGNLGLDDLCLTGTMLLNLPFTVFSVMLADLGLGKDIWEVPFDNITSILYLYFLEELFYTVALPLIKVSILFFYLRIFPDHRFRQISWILISCNFVYIIAYFLITLLQCRPIRGAWTRWDGTFQGTCNDTNLQIWMSAGINIVLDVAMLCLPLPSLYKLNLSPRKKFQIFLMFGVGFFVTIVSIIRIQSLVKWAYSTNITQDYVSVGYWSTIEVHVGIICACMPAMKGLFQKTLPRTLESVDVRSTPYQFNSSDTARRPSSRSRGLQKSSKQDDGSSAHELIEASKISISDFIMERSDIRSVDRHRCD